MDKPRIVAIDDEVDFVGTIKDYLQLREYEIETASKPAQGLELINNNNPDVIILDLKMPGVNGEEVLELIKSKQLKAKVIFVSAFDDGGKTKARMLEAGAFAFLDKPLRSLKELEDTITRAYSEKN